MAALKGPPYDSEKRQRDDRDGAHCAIVVGRDWGPSGGGAPRDVNEDDRVIDEIDRAADEIVQFTADLVRIPTVNPPGEAYEPCARLIGDRLSRGGFEVEYFVAE